MGARIGCTKTAGSHDWILLNRYPPPPNLPMETTVAELIVEDSNWNEAKLKHHFFEEDTEAILKISLPQAIKKIIYYSILSKEGNTL